MVGRPVGDAMSGPHVPAPEPPRRATASPSTGRRIRATSPATSAIATSIEIRFADTDAMGHVNNAVYLTYAEAARLGVVERRHRRAGQPRGATGPRA